MHGLMGVNDELNIKTNPVLCTVVQGGRLERAEGRHLSLGRGAWCSSGRGRLPE